jgi:hypothetical protein
MKKNSLFSCLSILILVLVQFANAHGNDFFLLENYPLHGQVIKISDLHDNAISFKFSRPVDRSAEGLLRLSDKTANSICQLNICGIVKYEENDTKLIWIPDDPAALFLPGKSFEIQIGDPNPAVCPVPPLPCSPVLFRDVSKNTLPMTYIDFEIDKCQPTAYLQLSGNTPLYCPDCINFCLDDAFVPGDTISVNIGIKNPECGSAVGLEAKVWVELPDGSLLSLSDPHATIQVKSGEVFSADIFHHKFLGYEPMGRYKVGFRILNPASGDFYSTGVDSFILNHEKCSNTSIFPGMEFSLRPGEERSIIGEDLVVGFKSVDEDSRCPAGLQCFWEGNAKVTVELKKSGQALSTVQLDTSPSSGFSSKANYLNYTIQLIDLLPYPHVDSSILESDYIARFVVSRF